MASKEDIQKGIDQATAVLAGVLKDNSDIIKSLYNAAGRKGVTIPVKIRLQPGSGPEFVDGSVKIRRPATWLDDEAEFTINLKQGALFNGEKEE